KSRVGAACVDPDGVGPRVLCQTVPESKTIKNRVHLDLRPGVDDRAAEVARLEALGARKLWDGQQGPQTWVTMADPEGNEFCVS
ncbi:MAG: VOC family protein, partial [Mycobacteriales bacterium]